MAPLRYLRAVVCLAGLAVPVVAAGQAAQNATVRRAQQAYDNLEYRQVLTLARAALRERLRFTVPQPARVVARGIGTGATVVIDSGAWNGQVNLRWPARLPGGDPVPAGAYTVVVDARLGQNTFSASQPIRVGHGRVDTLPSITSLPGYQFLPETEIPPQSWRPVGLAFLYTGGALVGTLGLEGSSLGSSSKRELGLVGGAALVTGFVMMLRKPAPRPAEANILYNRLLRDQIARRNQDIAKENVARRQQVQVTVTPVPK